jgi:hypothetical protein
MLKINLEVQPIPKIYYNNYAFKVVVKGNQWNHDAVRFEEMYKWLHDNKNVPEIWSDFTSVQRKSLSLYFTKASIVENFVNEFEDIVIEVFAPYNNEVWEHLKKGDYDCREKLYFGKYRYRVELGKHWKSKESEAIKIDNIVTNLYKRGSNRIHRSRSGYTHILYTNEKHDIAKIKLVLKKESVRELKVCKLYSETMET